MAVPQPELGPSAGAGMRARGTDAAAVRGEEPNGTARRPALTPRERWETTAEGDGPPPAAKAPLVFLGRIDSGGGQSGCARPVGSGDGGGGQDGVGHGCGRWLLEEESAGLDEGVRWRWGGGCCTRNNWGGER